MARLAAMMPCVVSDEKLRVYLLDLAHPTGAPKARFFTSAGYSVDRLGAFAEALRNHAAEREIEAEFTTSYGKKYLVRCRLQTPDGRDPCIVSIWFDDGDGRAHLVSAYPH